MTERRGTEAPARAAGSARPFCRPVKCHGSLRLLPAAAAPRVAHLGKGQKRGAAEPAPAAARREGAPGSAAR